ncbi:HpcH/HpaI aldolase/citrate lyase family protein [Hydromonas duriensis]|uniref:Citrate lyase subunit beta/citryl-CoA lyase n=1 Tax=Hydromonas duriensis TaxID=1527608 RepID=A0A4R6YAZ6_9BURK|nr:aldolase/citrate lyase family protein [Hydromonas duriensis]TDR32781.1 citrate lyase subunit beta/citryl-CoA lyase [Hydromonas duriensis]
MTTHPAQILFSDSPAPKMLSPVDHYAGNERFIGKAIAKQIELNGAFDIALDLEDGASVGQESAQARLMGEVLASSDNVFNRLGVRIHDASHEHWRADVEIVLKTAKRAPAYWMIPKVGDLSQTRDIVTQIKIAHHNADIALPPLHILIETHAALHDVYHIAALPEVESLSFGLMDFISAHHGTIPAQAMSSPKQFEHPIVAYCKLAISRACAAHGKVASHNVTTDYATANAAFNDARRARDEFGYSRMWSIHPNQIDEILRAFAPEEDMVDFAAGLLGQAAAANWGPISYAGKLHDRASFRYFWLIIQRAHALGQKMPSNVAQWF